MSSTGTTTSISSGLRMPASTMVTVGGAGRRRSKPPRKRAISSSGRCVADSPMRWGAGVRHELLEPLEGEGQVGAALGGGEGVDLVDDDGLDAGAASRRPGDVSIR